MVNFRRRDIGHKDPNGFFLHFLGRLKDMIITGGENVYSAEVEGIIFNHPAVPRRSSVRHS